MRGGRVAHTAARSTSSSPVPSSTDTERAALIIAPQWIGDAIVSLPLISRLAKDRGHIDVLAVPAVEAVYRCSPDVRRVITAPFVHGKLQWGLRRQIARNLSGQYALAVVLPNSLKSALIPWWAGIDRRRGMRGEARSLLLHEVRDPPRPDGHRPDMVAHYLQLADDPPGPQDIDAMGQDRPRMAIADPALRGSPDPGLLALCPGAEYGPAKQWPIERFAEVAAAWLGLPGTITDRGDRSVIVLGGPRDAALGESLRAMAVARLGRDPGDRLRNLCGATTLLEAFAMLARAGRAVSNDSGLMHAAAALDVPVVAIFGSTDPRHTPPHSPHARVVTLGLSCSPCFARTCPLGTTACLRDILPQHVLQCFDDPSTP